ncbi:MAG: fused MFS/spermidine synthase [Casimicrobiaceae bacterium]
MLDAITIFLSALLLFMMQPIMAKQILPWFGGSAAVWATCVVFFQCGLLAGYAYADLAIRRLRPRTHLQLHLALLALSVATLSFIPAAHWAPVGAEIPSLRIVAMLTATIGLPYVLLSTTSPTVQAWLARRRPGVNPYRLFALSNLASMLGLLSYPFLLEPWLPTRTLAVACSVAYAAFAVLYGLLGWRSLRNAADSPLPGRLAGTSVGTAPGSLAAAAQTPPSWTDQVMWGVLAATASALLLAVTNHVTRNVAAVPLLWVVPLAIYLLTFIITFDRPGWYRRPLFPALAAVAVVEMAWAPIEASIENAMYLQLGIFSLGLFLTCIFCHGELVRLKPAPAHLTRFYLVVALGGAVGSFAVGIVAPVALPADFELAIALTVCAMLIVLRTFGQPKLMVGFAIAATAITIACGVVGVGQFYKRTILASRNFYGVLRVQEGRDPNHYRALWHGTILHGLQYLDASLKRRPTTYYTETGGIGRLLVAMGARPEHRRVGVIGLGVGTLAAYDRTGDLYRFYEINPDVVDVARRDFTYLADASGKVEVVLGDARLQLERESPQRYDVLAVDAFSSDAIPVHLITREALAIYLRHLDQHGVIAFHVTNRFLNLVPVVAALAHEQGLHALHVADPGDDPLASGSDWVLLSREGTLLDGSNLGRGLPAIEQRREWSVWTDDFNNLVQVLR